MTIESTNLSFNDWEELKRKIKFQHSTLNYDTDPGSVLRVLGQKQLLEEMVLNRFELFWRNVFGPEGFASFTFPYEGVFIRVRAFSDSFICRMDLWSFDLERQCEEIRGKFFPAEVVPTERGEYLAKAVMDYATKDKTRLPDFNFMVTNREHSSHNITDALGKGIDPKIIKLVEQLNELGLYTTMSCEGHRSRALPYPWVEMTMISLPKFLSLLSKMEDKSLQRSVLRVFKDDFRFQPPKEFTLEQGQQLFKELSCLLSTKMRE